MPPVSMTSAVPVAAGVVNTGGKFDTGVFDTGGKFAIGVVEIGSAPCSQLSHIIFEKIQIDPWGFGVDDS